VSFREPAIIAGGFSRTIRSLTRNGSVLCPFVDQRGKTGTKVVNTHVFRFGFSSTNLHEEALMELNTIEYVRVIIMLAFMEGILSIDNAAIIGAMAAKLPHEPIPLPTWLSWARKGFDKLGLQPAAALKVGLLGAYIGRGAMLFVATFITENVVIKLIGAAYLIKLGMKHLSHADQPGEAAIIHKQQHSGFWATVLSIEIMDLIFSLDNVVTAVAICPNIWAVFLGVGIGILLMRFAATIFIKLITIEPRLTQAAYVLILQIGIELVVAEIWHYHLGDMYKFAVSMGTIAIVFIYSRIHLFQRVTQPLFVWLGQGLGNINELVDWALLPITATGGLAWRYISSKKQVAPTLATDD
jgi:tellurite resistance protein TerC